MSERKKHSSLVVNLVIMVGLGFTFLTAIQVTALTKLAKSKSRADHVESYVMLTNSIKLTLERTIEGYYKELDAYVNADI